MSFSLTKLTQISALLAIFFRSNERDPFAVLSLISSQALLPIFKCELFNPPSWLRCESILFSQFRDLPFLYKGRWNHITVWILDTCRWTINQIAPPYFLGFGRLQQFVKACEKLQSGERKIRFLSPLFFTNLFLPVFVVSSQEFRHGVCVQRLQT